MYNSATNIPEKLCNHQSWSVQQIVVEKCFPVYMAIFFTTMFLHALGDVNLDPPQGL